MQKINETTAVLDLLKIDPVGLQQKVSKATLEVVEDLLDDQKESKSKRKVVIEFEVEVNEKTGSLSVESRVSKKLGKPKPDSYQFPHVASDGVRPIVMLSQKMEQTKIEFNAIPPSLVPYEQEARESLREKKIIEFEEKKINE